LELTLTVVRNYSVPQLQPAKGGAQGSKHVITQNAGRAVPELGYHV